MPDIDLIDTSWTQVKELPTGRQVSQHQGHNLRCFPSPKIIAAIRPPCGDGLCQWVYAPDISGYPEYPWVLKFPNRNCPEHKKDYYV